MYLEWSYKVVCNRGISVHPCAERTNTDLHSSYSIMFAVTHVARILWIIGSDREVVQKLVNHDYSVYPKKKTLSDVSSVHNIHPEHSDSVFAHFLASSDPISPTKLFRGPQTHANIH